MLNEKICNVQDVFLVKEITQINKMLAHCFNPQLARGRVAVFRLASTAVNHNESSLVDWITITVCFMALKPRLNNSRECKTLVPRLV